MASRNGTSHEGTNWLDVALWFDFYIYSCGGLSTPSHRLQRFFAGRNRLRPFSGSGPFPLGANGFDVVLSFCLCLPGPLGTGTGPRRLLRRFIRRLPHGENGIQAERKPDCLLL
jgi:hypothetical protein